MKITHIFHSGFMVETEKSVLLFDWYRGKLPKIPAGKRLYVFCSHAHEDHYSPMIWDLQKKIPEVTYILDAGIPDAVKHPEAEVVTVEPRQAYAVRALRIRTLTSTDMGVAFYIETEGKRIYHAGDLNVWYWFDEALEDNISSEKRCRAEMQYLADSLCGEKDSLCRENLDGKAQNPEKESVENRIENTPRTKKVKKPLLDLAFVPLDPRLREEAPRCMAAFAEILDASYIFPMHYWEREEETRQYLSDSRLLPVLDRIHFDPVMEI